MRVSDRQSGTGRKQRKLWIVLILAIVVILGVVIAVNQSSSKQESSTEKSEENEEASKVTDAAEDAAEEDEEDAEETDEGLAFPYLLEEEQIQVDSLFQYSGINPDAENAECEDVAAIQMKNNSEQYLESAEVSVELSDGTAYSFVVQDIPAGKSVIAFESGNTSYDGKTGVAFIEAKTSYSSEAGVKEDEVKVTSDDNGVQISNISGDAIETMKVKYHCVMDDMYFGGISSETEVDGLAAGESTAVDTSESILGDADVVSITY